MHFSILSDLKKTTAVVESLSTTSTRCSVTEITSLLQDYRFKSADILCEQFNKFVNILKKGKKKQRKKYPWLEPDDEKRNMSDREILSSSR